MKKFLLLSLLSFSLLFVSCEKESESKDTYGYFKDNLKADMKYTALVSLFGEPDADQGSGIHIYIYYLQDGTRIRIGYTDHIHYADHVDAAGNVLHSLI